MEKVISILSTFILVSILTSGLILSCNPKKSASVMPQDILNTEVPKPNHVVIVILENHSFDQIINTSKQTNYFYSLAHGSSSALFTNSHGMTHPSQPNYLFLFSGSRQTVKGDEMPAVKYKSPNLAASLLAIDSSFKTYAEDLPSVGFNGQVSGGTHHMYVRKHNPMTNWMRDKISDTSEKQIPDSLNQPFSVFKSISEQSDFSKLPTVSFVIPNLENDLHGENPSQIIQKRISADEEKEAQEVGNNWLRQNIESYADWAIKNNSLLIITFDEDNHLSRQDTINHIPTIFVGQMVKPGEYNSRITHCNVLATLLKMYNLSPTVMGNANRDNDCIKYCWK